MSTLALTALYGTRSLQLNLCGNAEHTLQFGSQLLLQCLYGSRCIEGRGKYLLTQLCLYQQGVEVVDTIHNQQVVRCELGQREDNALHLRGEYVDTTNDKHIVGTTLNTSHTHIGTTAVASAGQQRAEVACTITQYGHTLLGQRGEHQLTRLSHRQGLKGYRVDNLGEEMVFVDVRAVLHLTLVADAGAHHFGKSVDVKALQTQTSLNLLTHALRPRLSTEGTHTQLQVFLLNAQLIHCLSQIQGVRGGTSQTCNTQVANQLQMLLRVTRSCRDTRGTQVLHTIVSAQTARKQAIAVSHREDIIACHAIGS